MVASFSDFTDRAQAWFNDLVDNIRNLPQLISDKFSELFETFFVLDQEAADAKLQAIRERFDFIYEYSELGERIMTFMENASGETAPVFYVDLSDYTGNYNWGNTVITIDFSWYAQFKPLVDAIVAGIIWITFLWHLYKRLPEIISGQGMTTANVLRINDNLESRGGDDV